MLEIMVYKVQCNYLSDLRYLCMEPETRKRLADIVEEIPVKSATLFEWNDALKYLTHISSAENKEKAKKTLIDYLRT